MNKIIIKALFIIGVFVTGFSIWYSPLVFKGFAPYRISELLPLAKNIHETGKFSLESDKNVYLASSLIKEKGQTSIVGNKFTAYLYAWIFKFTGVLNPSKLILASLILNSLSLMVFAFVVLKLFGLKISALFSATYILGPFNWESVYSIGVYEFAVLFISLFFLFFVLSRKNKYEFLHLFLAGVFLGLAGLARETFFIFIPVLVFYFWRVGKIKSIAHFAIPVFVLLSLFYLPGIFKGENAYSNLFSSKQTAEKKFTDFTFYGHLYPDPYVYHKEKKEFLNQYVEKTEKAGLIESLQMKKVLANMGERGIGFFERISLGIVLLLTHLANFLALDVTGGPFVLFFAVIGLIYLKKEDNSLYKFFVYWVSVTVFTLSFVVLVSRSHLKDFNWLIPLTFSLGIVFLLLLIEEKLTLGGKKKNIFAVFVAATAMYGLLVADHAVFGRIYDKNQSRKIEAYAEKIKSENVAGDAVIAIGLDSKEQVLLNYLADRSTVVITPETVTRLIDEGKLKEALVFFNAKHILGYSDDLSAKIMENTNVASIASSSFKINEDKTSAGRSFIMNLVK